MARDISVARVESGYPVEALMLELSAIPTRLLRQVRPRWYLLSSPLRTGLLKRPYSAGDGRLYETIGGWFADEDTSWLVSGDKPHIYLNGNSVWAATHEFGHAVDHWLEGVSQSLYRPERAIGCHRDYAATSAEEYFACSFATFLNQEERLQLQAADGDMYKFLERVCYGATQ